MLPLKGQMKSTGAYNGGSMVDQTKWSEFTFVPRFFTVVCAGKMRKVGVV